MCVMCKKGKKKERNDENIHSTWLKCLWNFFCLALLVDVGDDLDEDLLTFAGVCAPPAAIDGVLLLNGFERWLKKRERAKI